MSHKLIARVIDGDVDANPPNILWEEELPAGSRAPADEFQEVNTSGKSKNFDMQLWLPRQIWVSGEEITGKMLVSAVKLPIENFNISVRLQGNETVPQTHFSEDATRIIFGAGTQVAGNVNIPLGESKEFAFSLKIPTAPIRPTFESHNRHAKWVLFSVAGKGLRSVACNPNIQLYSDLPDNWNPPAGKQVKWKDLSSPIPEAGTPQTAVKPANAGRQSEPQQVAAAEVSAQVVERPQGNQQLSIILELVIGILGFLGIGWLIRGDQKTGLILIVSSVVWTCIAYGLAAGTSGVSAICTIPLTMTAAITSTILLSNAYKKE
jgi:hypothetical protein